MAKIFIICPVRNADPAIQEEIRRYIERLEEAGHHVHWPPRDTNQSDLHGIRICMDNCDAIIAADEVHIWYAPASRGSFFDRGMVFALHRLGFEKKVVGINTVPPARGLEGIYSALDVFGEIGEEEAGEVYLWFDQTNPEFLFEGGMLFALLRLGFKKKLVLLNDSDVQPTPERKSFANVFRALADGRDIAREDAADILSALITGGE